MLSIDMTNKIALVIGGSRGIGAAIVSHLCRAGAATVFTHTGKPEHHHTVQALVDEVKQQDGAVWSEAVDACNSSETTQLVDRTVQRHGKVDCLVCNAGQNLACPAETVSDEQWRHYIDVNLTSAFYAVRAVLPHMLNNQYGRIILIGSSAAYDGGGGAIDYAAAKAGLKGIMLYLSKNYARKGILTNIVDPCLIETELLKKRYSDQASRKKLISQVPVGRLGQPDDIAALVAFMASKYGDFICGQSILVDGGRTLFK